MISFEITRDPVYCAKEEIRELKKLLKEAENRLAIYESPVNYYQTWDIWIKQLYKNTKYWISSWFLKYY